MAAPQTSPRGVASIDAVDVSSEPTITGDEKKMVSTAKASAPSSSVEINGADPMDLGRHRRDNVTQRQLKLEHPRGNMRLLKKYYTRQNELIDQFLGADDEERVTSEEDARLAPKIKFAVNASFTVNFCLFVIQMYAAISTGSLSLFATAADAFVGRCGSLSSMAMTDRLQMDLVSSFVMLITSKLAARPSVYKYPVVGTAHAQVIVPCLSCPRAARGSRLSASSSSVR
jgi:ABC-type multidrug transport system fused ATPase/permease subunit